MGTRQRDKATRKSPRAFRKDANEDRNRLLGTLFQQPTMAARPNDNTHARDVSTTRMRLTHLSIDYAMTSLSHCGRQLRRAAHSDCVPFETAVYTPPWVQDRLKFLIRSIAYLRFTSRMFVAILCTSTSGWWIFVTRVCLCFLNSGRR
jgi:hypothetical protein